MQYKQRSDAILKFLGSHQLISRNALCTIFGYDSGNLQRCFSGERVIPERYLLKFETELKKYGFINANNNK